MIALAWEPRAVPLSPRAVAAFGPTARALGRRVAALDDEALAPLAAVAGRDHLVVLGPEASLPWVDGVVYLGLDPAAPSLLLPTALAPTVPAPVLARAVLKRVGAHGGPVAVIAAPSSLISCAQAVAIGRASLAAWLRAAEAA